MFYVSSKRGNKIGVTDTRDGIEEFYELHQLRDFIRQGISIDGIIMKQGDLRVSQGRDKSIIEKLSFLPLGIPLRIKMSKNLPFKQCLFAGRDNGIFSFIDKSGLFELSSRYLVENLDSVKFDFDNNIPEEVADLKKLLN